MRDYAEETSEADVAPYRSAAVEVEHRRPSLERHERLLKALAQQGNLIDQLTERVEDALLPERPSPMLDGVKSGPEDKPVRSNLADQYEQLQAVLATQMRKLENLRDRIDL